MNKNIDKISWKLPVESDPRDWVEKPWNLLLCRQRACLLNKGFLQMSQKNHNRWVTLAVPPGPWCCSRKCLINVAGHINSFGHKRHLNWEVRQLGFILRWLCASLIVLRTQLQVAQETGNLTKFFSETTCESLGSIGEKNQTHNLISVSKWVSNYKSSNTNSEN